MPNLFRPTIVLLLVIVGVATAYDLWAVSQHYEWTISANLWQVARYTNAGPPLTLITGFLIGHVVFPNRGATMPPPTPQAAP